MLISDFARLGQVSVRMLRHYDRLGVLEPDTVDPANGYRSYSPEQLHTLNRLVALKDLGFSLDQVRRLLAESPDADELRGMLRLRRAELEEQARVVGTRLTAVESRLRMIEQEQTMTQPDYVVKTVPAERLVATTATMEVEEMPQRIGPMFADVGRLLAGTPAALARPIATYAETEQGMDVVVGYACAAEPPAGTVVVDLPERRAVCGVHLGSMATIGESWQALHRWLVAGDYRFAGPCRELYVRTGSDDQSDWVTELQQPVEP